MIIRCFIRKFLRKPFNSNRWKNDIRQRKYYIDDILENLYCLGLQPENVHRLFGPNESYNVYSFNRWSYFVDKRNKRKLYLAIYFENNKVAKMKYEHNI